MIDMMYLDFRLLQLFKNVFPYRNGSGRLIMDTEKVHSIKHCHVDVTNYANPINYCCEGPEGGHKTWVLEQGLKTNQGPSAANDSYPEQGGVSAVVRRHAVPVGRWGRRSGGLD